MAGSTKSNRAYIVDASYVLAFLLPDEENQKADSIFEQFKEGKIELFSTHLLPFEVLNGLRSAVIQKRLKVDTAEILAAAFVDLGIKHKEVVDNEVFKLALKNNNTVYDAGYVWLAMKLDLPLLSLDNKLSV